MLVRAQRTRLDFAGCVKRLVDDHSPAAERIVRVLDHRNTHSPASRSAAFPPVEAKRLADKLKIRHTLKRSSWLTMAELELNVLPRQCLRQQLDDRDAMERETTAWAHRRNAQTNRIARPFTSADARIKLLRRYPAFAD